MEKLLMDVREVQEISGLSHATIYRLIADKSFPAPIRIGRRAVRWHVDEIKAWVANCPRAGSRELLSGGRTTYHSPDP